MNNDDLPPFPPPYAKYPLDTIAPEPAPVDLSAAFYLANPSGWEGILIEDASTLKHTSWKAIYDAGREAGWEAFRLHLAKW